MGWFDRLSQGLTKTRQAMQSSLDRLFGRGPDQQTLEELEAALLGADLGVRTVDRLMERLRQGATRRNGDGEHGVRAILQDEILQILSACQGEDLLTLIERSPRPFVLLAVGVNGVGKTTTMAKIAQRRDELVLKSSQLWICLFSGHIASGFQAFAYKLDGTNPREIPCNFDQSSGFAQTADKAAEGFAGVLSFCN